jgi:hypothetical protein
MPIDNYVEGNKLSFKPSFQASAPRAADLYRQMRYEEGQHSDDDLIDSAGIIDPRFRSAEMVRVLKRMAKQCDESQFIEALTKGNIPPMKLTAREMELFSGGTNVRIVDEEE